MAPQHLPGPGSPPGERAARGRDGLTETELRRGRDEWWDDAFTSLLLEALPDGPCRILDLGCGYGQAAATLLPALPEARYTGVDIDSERVAACGRVLAPWSDRARAITGSALELPLDPDRFDAVLCVSTLMHIPNVPATLAEILRVLRPGGRLVAVEPDNRVQIFRFDGPLSALDEAFGALYARLGEIGKPAHPELGPCLPALMTEAGFSVISVRVHVTQSARQETAEAFLDRTDWVADLIAASAGLAEDEPALVRCRELLQSLRSELAGRNGYSLHAVPSWRCVGE